MSEQLKPRIETSQEHLDLSNEAEKNLERIGKENVQHDEQQNTGDIQRRIEHQAVSGTEVSIESDATCDSAPIGLHQELKDQSYKRTMERVQSHLSKPEKAFSKAVHSPAVDSISNAFGKTIVRPSGVLGGGLLALAGSAFLFYSASYFGFSYNYTAFFLLYAAGFVLGLFVEAVLKLLNR
jgi:hypothetical protein